MAGRAASLERLAYRHPAAAAWAWVDRLICCGFCCGGTVGRLLLLHRLHRCRRRDQFARPRDGLRLAAAGQQPVVPDAVEAVRQDVDQKPADELAWLERHGLIAAGPLDPVVFVAKRNAGRVDGDEPAPQVWSTDVKPIRTPSRLGSAAIVRSVSDEALNKR